MVTNADVRDVTTHRARLDAEFGTPIFKNLTELVTYLAFDTPPAQASRPVHHDARRTQDKRDGLPGTESPPLAGM